MLLTWNISIISAGPLARIGVEIVELVLGQTRGRILPIALEASLHTGCQTGPLVDHHVVAAAEAVTVEEQRGLVHAVDDAIGRDVGHRATKPSKGREEVADVQDVADDLAGLDHAGPRGEARHADAAFGEVAFAAGVERLDHAARP